MNLRLMLEEAVRKYGTKTALVMEDRRISFSQLNEDSNRVANALIKLGVKKGDRVAILLSNSLEFINVYLGITKCGAIAVPLDTKYKRLELNALFTNCQPKALFIESAIMEGLAPALSRFSSILHVIDINGSKPYLDYSRLVAESSTENIDIAIQPDDVAHIAYTSGPTLTPRGVMLPHQSLVTETAIAAGAFKQTDKDVVILFALPLHHAFGLVVILLPSIYCGSTVVILPGLSISSLIETIEREKATMFMAVPFVYALINEMAEEKGLEHDLSSLRFCGSAGAALPPDVARTFERHLGMKIIDFWGQTESSAFIPCQSLNGTAKPGSVGKALPGWQVKIVDKDGRELPANHIGEIIARGPYLKGIYNNPQATARLLRNGWLYTGDLARIDDEGNVFLFGNSKGMLISKGQNIYPGDIETILTLHPKIAEAAAVGIPDETRGQVVGAAIRLKPGQVITEQEIKHFCLEHLANYKVPKQIIFVNTLPRTAEGSIDRETLISLLNTSK